MTMKFAEEVGVNVKQKSQFHSETFHTSPAHPSDISSWEIMTS